MLAKSWYCMCFLSDHWCTVLVPSPFVRLEDEAPEEVLLDVHRHVAATTWYEFNALIQIFNIKSLINTCESARRAKAVTADSKPGITCSGAAAAPKLKFKSRRKHWSLEKWNPNENFSLEPVPVLQLQAVSQGSTLHTGYSVIGHGVKSDIISISAGFVC